MKRCIVKFSWAGPVIFEHKDKVKVVSGVHCVMNFELLAVKQWSDDFFRTLMSPNVDSVSDCY